MGEVAGAVAAEDRGTGGAVLPVLVLALPVLVLVLALPVLVLSVLAAVGEEGLGSAAVVAKL